MTYASDLRDIFAACKTFEELLEQAGLLWDLRIFEGVVQYGVKSWQHYASILAPKARDEKVVAVDLPSILFASASVNKDSLELVPEHTLQMLRNIYRDTRPTVFLVADDAPVVRRNAIVGYKMGRPGVSQEAYDATDKAKELVRSKMNVLAFDNEEADDILASIAFRCRLLGCSCVMASKDKDLWQVLYPKTSILSGGEYRNSEWLLATHRIKHNQAVDWLALVGGKNGMTGCLGVGEKTASDWMEAYGSFVGVYEQREGLSERHKASVESFFDEYWTVREAFTLTRGLPVFWSPGQ